MSIEEEARAKAEKLFPSDFASEGDRFGDRNVYARGYVDGAARKVEVRALPVTELSRDNEPPVGTWVLDRHGAATMRQRSGWAPPGFHPTGQWPAMWDTRGPYTICGPWGSDLPEPTVKPTSQIAQDIMTSTLGGVFMESTVLLMMQRAAREASANAANLIEQSAHVSHADLANKIREAARQ